MKVVLYGTTGQSGSRILKELLARGHKVTAVTRKPSDMPEGVSSKQDDLSDVNTIASIIAGADAVVSDMVLPKTTLMLLLV